MYICVTYIHIYMHIYVYVLHLYIYVCIYVTHKCKNAIYALANSMRKDDITYI